MTARKPEGALTKEEAKIVKSLLSKGWRNQDIQAEINIGRSATINSARITEVKSNRNITPAADDILERFLLKKRSFDFNTGLNLFDDERLVRAREAMILAVQIFNSAGLRFKTEVFSVLANIAWTYLMHEYYLRRGVKIVNSDGQALLLSQILKQPECPLPPGVRENLLALKEIRDNAEHNLIGRSDSKWYSIFQACCLNFDKYICEFFGKKLSLATDLSFALQFSKMGIEQLAIAANFDIPEYIEALDARLNKDKFDTDEENLEYRFRVVYTLDAASKSNSHFAFVLPETAEGKDIRNVLVHYKPGDALYPYKPGRVCELVQGATKKRFTMLDHTKAWRQYKVRPGRNAAQPENTKKEFFIYHPAHGDYTYSRNWVDFLIDKIR